MITDAAQTIRTFIAFPGPSRLRALPARCQPLLARASFIINPLADYLLLILPLLALALGITISGTPIADEEITLFDNENSLSSMFIGTFIMAHLFIVFFRSHGNRDIFRLYSARFTLAPVGLFLAMCSSAWIAVSVSVLATWWDVYHSGMQTFGLGRVYDMKRGNDAQVGRRLDMWLNQLLYAGPILAGATLMDHVEDFEEFEDVHSVFFTSIPAYVESHCRVLTWTVLAIGVPFLVYYVFAYWRLHKRGYQISAPKVVLLVSTAACSIYTWGFNTFGEAFFIMNFFHALQYFALVWWTERKNMVNLFHLGGMRWAQALALGLFLAIGLGFGFWAEFFGNSDVAVNMILVVSIMHFWYDGFIWSVRKRQV